LVRQLLLGVDLLLVNATILHLLLVALLLQDFQQIAFLLL